MTSYGFYSTPQCLEKLKKKNLKSNYKNIKDHNSWSRSSKKWFKIMDAFYGHRPTSVPGLQNLTVLGEHDAQHRVFILLCTAHNADGWRRGFKPHRQPSMETQQVSCREEQGRA
ncbi:hypothetical protein ILYODFUR_017147 [Ilyodon furcidens]|uniref:Uncharacterized protein n=1 Tax=Ilyodon furcidens TaxID=33524 RepID=A0ABV0SZ60_9TELE